MTDLRPMDIYAPGVEPECEREDSLKVGRTHVWTDPIHS
jgi:hypothetical protein